MEAQKPVVNTEPTRQTCPAEDNFTEMSHYKTWNLQNNPSEIVFSNNIRKDTF